MAAMKSNNMFVPDYDGNWTNFIEVTPKSKSMYASSMLNKFNAFLSGIGDLIYTNRKGETFDISKYARNDFNLMSDGNTNAKTKKNFRPTRILYLTPASGSGKNFCGKSTPGCIWGCLNTAGRGVFKSVIAARYNRSQFIIRWEQLFLEKVAYDIKKLVRSKQAKQDYPQYPEVCVRLNGTSDLPLLEMLHKNGLLDDIPTNVIFYDYTKFPDKVGQYKVGKHKYFVTWSHAEDYFSAAMGKMVYNFNTSMQMLEAGNCVAVVFLKQIPKYWFGYLVIDGDERDDLMIDVYPTLSKGRGVVLGLRAKGKKILDAEKANGFPITCDDWNDCRNK